MKPANINLVDSSDVAKKKYSKTEKFKKSQRRYEKSPKGKEVKKRYIKTEKGMAAQLRYYNSKKGLMARETAQYRKRLLTRCAQYLKDNPNKQPSDFLTTLSKEDQKVFII